MLLACVAAAVVAPGSPLLQHPTVQAHPPPQIEYRTGDLPLLRSYTSSHGKDGSTLPDAELSSMSNISLEFGIRARSRQRTILWAWLTLSSPASWDGHTPSEILFSATVSVHGRSGDGLIPDTGTVSRCSIHLQNNVYSWSNEVTESIRTRLQASSIDSTEPTSASHEDWDWPSMPNYQETNLRDVLQMDLSWSASTSSTFIRIATERYADRSLLPTLSIMDSSESWISVRPLAIPDNITTGLTVSGDFDTNNWYSCGIASKENSTFLLRGPYTKAQTHSRLFCESPPVPAGIKRCADYDTLDTWGRCYQTLYLFITRRWRHPSENTDRDVLVAFSGVPSDARLVLTTPEPDLGGREPQEGKYENNAPFFEGMSRSTVGHTQEGFMLEKRGDYPGRHTVL